MTLKIKKDKWIGIDDGYGVVGWGFYCKKCGHFNMFASYYSEDVECENCGVEYLNLGNPEE